MAFLVGTSGADNLFGTSEADTIYGFDGNDTLNGSAGNDNIHGDRGNDLVIGGTGLDLLNGGQGDDTLSATTGEGNDTLVGGIGNDVYQTSFTTNVIIEDSNQGIDTVRSSISYTLYNANLENLVLTAATNINGTGNSIGNQITGNSGNNILNGMGGNDVLTGGGGNDQFLFNTVLSGTGDSITDFAVGNDKILLNKDIFSTVETGGPYVLGSYFPPTVLLPEDFAVINVPSGSEIVAAGNNSNEIVYNIQTGNLFYNSNSAIVGLGTNGGQFATIVGSPDNLSNTNFLVTASPPVP